MLTLIWGTVLVAVLVFFFRQTYSKFSKHGVKNMKVVPVFGNLMRIVFRKEHFTEDLERTYFTFSGERFVGRYEFMKPTVLVLDLDLLKKVTTKDFEHFIDHRSFIDESVDPLIGRNLFSLKGQEWKDMRSTLSPAFTSSKIKLMVPFIEEVGEQMIKVMKKQIQESNIGSIDVDVKDLTSRFAVDVIASCAFGLKVDSHCDKENQFYKMGTTLTTFNFRHLVNFLIMMTCPALATKFNITLFSGSTTKFFIDQILNTMKDREVHQIYRPDMIHLLMEAKKGRLRHDDKINNQQYTGFAAVEESSVGRKVVDRVWSDNDLIAQAFLFFIAGFETMSTAMSFTLHELALHSEIQERLVQEIKEHNVKNGGKLDFNTIQNMTYMDMVISEALRIWPPAMAFERICVKDYNMGKPNSEAVKDYIVKKGEIVSIPAWCFHNDPQLFPNPRKFDPERFSEENRHKINPMAYMPFGIGPRNCIASRFALCELKVLLYHILLHMEVIPCEKTCIPSKLTLETFSPQLDGGHWLKFKSRC